MMISFHGAAGNVTGSKHLITLDDGRKILLDCGLFQGLGTKTAALNADFGFAPAELEAVFLSHAHIDHSGLLPKLVAAGFTGSIFCTRATWELSLLLLMDSAQIQAHSYPPEDNNPCFTVEDVHATGKLVQTVEFDKWFEPLRDIRAQFTRTGHLAGAAAISLDLPADHGRTTLFFSGDVGRASHPLWKPAAQFPQAEYLILESTYGDRDHDLILSNVDIMLDHIRNTCLRKNGKLIIPAFSIGRTQELLYLLRQLDAEKRLPELLYFVDSPLGVAATHTLAAQKEEFAEKLREDLDKGIDPFAFTGLRYIDSTDDSIRLGKHDEPCVIIASSGTADAGRVRCHIREALSDPRHTILFSGYCGPQTFGGELLAGKKVIHLGGEEFEVRADIQQLKGLSAHGDANDLAKFISCQDPARVRGVFIVHGEQHARERLAVRLQAKNFFPVTLPALHDTVTLNRHASKAAIA